MANILHNIVPLKTSILPALRGVYWKNNGMPWLTGYVRQGQNLCNHAMDAGQRCRALYE